MSSSRQIVTSVAATPVISFVTIVKGLVSEYAYRIEPLMLDFQPIEMMRVRPRILVKYL